MFRPRSSSSNGENSNSSKNKRRGGPWSPAAFLAESFLQQRVVGVPSKDKTFSRGSPKLAAAAPPIAVTTTRTRTRGSGVSLFHNGLRDSLPVIAEHHHQDDYPNNLPPRDFDDSSPPSLARSGHDDDSEEGTFSSISLSGSSYTPEDHSQVKYVSFGTSPIDEEQKQDEEAFYQKYGFRPVPFVACCDPIDNDADLSIAASSVNFDTLREVRDLKQKLQVQEDTKVELLQQLQEHSSLASYLSLLEKENSQLREKKAKIEVEYMYDMQKLLAKMNEMRDDLEFRDDMIESLEAELRCTKNNLVLCTCSQ